jgi:uncharacterized protein
MIVKLFRRLIAATAILLAPSAAFAQTAAAAQSPKMVDADPALWVVKDKDTTIYLFGTIHVLKPGLSWFDEAVKTAFDKSDTLVLEMVQPDAATMQKYVVAKAFDPASKPLTDRLSPTARPVYLKALADYGLPSALFDHAQPWFVATNLTIMPLLKLGYDPAQGPESVLTKAAAASNKPVLGLETAEEQIGFLSGLPAPVQMKFLESTLKDLPRTGVTIGRMVDAWSHGDPAKLGVLMNEGMNDAPQLAQTLLYDRNARWARWIKARMAKPGTVFIAVGAGHLAGPKSVLAQLKAMGLTPKRIAY